MNQVVIAGGGYSALTLALEIRRSHDLGVTICEREHEPDATLEELRVEAAMAGVSFLTDTIVVSLTKLPDRKVEVNTIGVRGPQSMPASAVVIATGARERSASARYIAGAQISGVMTGSEVDRAVIAGHHDLGSNAVVLGADKRAFESVRQLRKLGIRTKFLVTPWSTHQVSWWRNLWSRIRYVHAVRTNTYITHIHGSTVVSGVTLTHRDGRESNYVCDVVVVTGDWISQYEVALRSGLLIDRQTKGPAIDTAGRSSRRGVFAVGAVVQPTDDVELTNISATAEAVAEYVTKGVWPEAITIDYAAPIDWIEPAFLGKGHHAEFPEFVVCVGIETTKRTIQVRQDTTLLAEYQIPAQQMQPAVPFVMSGSWIAEVDPQGSEISIRLVG
ncbi:MAG: hypothetical protein F2839_02430 [Actinobacteria bacterium]|uniref:Unannotated protein n=1 Tax=freshwater metagenome TaxID=449393 RepID=A0A6J5YWF3_9ZZZZ|nr:hypothetical protein [Actinomycetota bacterium]